MKGELRLKNLPKTSELFDVEHTICRELFYEVDYAYEIIPEIKSFIGVLAGKLGKDYLEIKRGVFVAEDTKIAEGATILAPAIIGHGVEIRPGAYLRGSVIIGDGAVIGNSTEVKNSIIFDGAKLPHYNYVGDSIIGYNAHMGAGSIASNQRLDKAEISIEYDGELQSLGLRKMGVLLGDYAEVGCGSVICPGSIIGREAVIYPLSLVKGIIPEACVYNGKAIKEKRIK